MNLSKSNYKYEKETLKKLLYDYNKEPSVLPNDKPKKVEIWDETLRDGEQTPGVFLNYQDKRRIARALDEIGVKKIAVGFPAVSQQEFEIVKKINAMGLNQATILGIARPLAADIEKCLACDLDEIVLFMPVSDLHLHIMKKSREEQINMIQTAFDFCKDHEVEYNWVSEDASRANPEHLLRINQLALDNSATSLILGDTVGVLQPETAIYIMNLFKQNLKFPSSSTTQIGIHTHNDFGQAVATTVAAVFHGATLPHVCVNGYGERAGNAALEEVVVNLEQNNIKTGVDMTKLSELSKLVEEIFALPLSAHKAIVGSNAFSHESGMHINAMLAHPMAYEPIAPQWVGQHRRIYLGKHSGSGSIINALRTKLKMSDINLPRSVIKDILRDLKNLQEESSKEEKYKIFKQTKKLIEDLRPGINDTEFFNIIKKHAHEYLKDTWAEIKEKVPQNSNNSQDKLEDK